MQTVKIHDSMVLAKESKVFGGLVPIRYTSRKVAEKKAQQIRDNGKKAEVYQPYKGIYVKVG